MRATSDLIRQLLDYYTLETLSEITGIKATLLTRSLTSVSILNNDMEAKLKELHSTTVENKLSKELFKEILDKILIDLRETLHRKGRISSRNEAIDQLSSLLFAQIMSLKHNDKGIGALSESEGFDGNEATVLKNFVEEQIKKFIPIQLNHEISWKDFELKIKNSENSFAKEIIKTFNKSNTLLAFSTLKTLDEVDIFNEVFGKFLANSFVDEKELGQYLTPKEIVKSMVEMSLRSISQKDLDILIHPENCKNFGIILDPSCGVSSFLSEILRRLYKEVVNQYGPKKAKIWLENMANNVIYGIDKSERMVKLTIANFATFGIQVSNIHLANSLEHSSAKVTEDIVGRVKLILTNPPFGAEFSGEDLNTYKIAQGWTSGNKIDSEILFLERYLDWLQPGGQAIMIVPDSILTNKGIFERLRTIIAENAHIKGVLSLPSETFSAAGTTTKTSILHLQKINNDQIEMSGTYFAICEDIGYKVAVKGTQKIKISSSKNDLDLVLSEYNLNKKPSFGTYVWGASNESRWDATYHASLPKVFLEIIKNKENNLVFLSDVAMLINERINPKKIADEQSTFSYIEISNIDSQTFKVSPNEVSCLEAPSRARKLVRRGDVLFSTVRPERGTIGIVTEKEDGSICTTGLAVLRPIGIDSLTLSYLLKSELVLSQILRFNTGIAYPVIDESCLLSVILPIDKDSLATYHDAANEVLKLQQELNQKRELFKTSIQRSLEDWIKS